MTCLLVPGRDETKTNLLVDTADAAIYSVLFFFVCLCVFVSRGVSNMSAGVTSIPHISYIQ